MNRDRGEDSAARRAVLNEQIRSGIKLPDEFSVLCGLIKLIDCAQQYPAVVQLVQSSQKPSQRIRTECVLARLLVTRMRQKQLTNLIFLRRCHLTFLIRWLHTPGFIAPEEARQFLAMLRQHVYARYSSEIDLAVREELAFLQHRAREGNENDDQEASSSPGDVDVLLRTPMLDEYDVFTDIIRLLNLGRQFTKLLRRHHGSIELSYKALGSQPVASEAKSVEGLCRRWTRGMLPDLISELLQINMQTSVLSTLDNATDLATADGHNGEWQRELWPTWLADAAEIQWNAADSLVRAVLELHELGPEELMPE